MAHAEPTLRVGIDRDELRHWVRRTLTALSQTGALPLPTDTGARVVAALRDPGIDAAQLVRLVESDVGLSARVLRHATAAPDRRAPVRTLADAVAAMGVAKARELLLLACARPALGPDDVQTRTLWSHALATALASEELAAATHAIPPGEAFLPGLLHDLGRIAFLLADGMSFDVIAHAVAVGEGDALDLEREWYGFTHAEAGAVLAEDWGLAPDQCEAIRWHHAPEEAPQGRALARILADADRVAHAAGLAMGPRRADAGRLAHVALSIEATAACAARVRRACAEHLGGSGDPSSG